MQLRKYYRLAIFLIQEVLKQNQLVLQLNFITYQKDLHQKILDLLDLHFLTLFRRLDHNSRSNRNESKSRKAKSKHRLRVELNY